MKKFQGHSETITCVDIPRRLHSTSERVMGFYSTHMELEYWQARGKLMAGPIKSVLTTILGAVRFSQNSKLAVNGWMGKCLEVWDIKTQKLDRKVGTEPGGNVSYTPFRTKQETVLAAFTFADSSPTTICEFDASTLDLDTIEAPLEGYSKTVRSLAFSFDDAFLPSASNN